MGLNDPLTDVKGVGPALAAKFKQLGLTSVADIINYYPRRYDDYSALTPVGQLTTPGPVTIQAKITSIKGRYVRRGMHITEAIASDDTGSTRLVWFNQPYREAGMKRDQPYFISGNFELSYQRFAIQNPTTELVSDLPVNTARIVPIYREMKGLNSRQIRAVLKELMPALHRLPETLPTEIVQKHKLMSYAEAVTALHFPDDSDHLAAARRRLGFEEVFELSLASLMNKLELSQEKAPAVVFHEALAKEFVGHLPFTLTDAQRKVVWQIYQDMQKTQPMNRLIEGDVGSGKTVVAAMAALMALHAGHQVALMAPTELLARQHADTLHKLLQPLGYETQVGLLVGSMTTKQKQTAREQIQAGQIRFMVGTNALIQESVDMQKLELVIIDEQHRFGVNQRKELQIKAGHMPHVLSLTATPIPRSLALTLYGELDVSILDVKPGGRKPIITKIISPGARDKLYAHVEAQLVAGRQAFVVCPLITESSVLDANSVEKTYAELSKKHFKHRRVGLLHGKQKGTEKNAVMQDFIDKKLDILVSTTVIEVGVDVPNATVMLIENAERFGLAQVHQLRGRVGRSSYQGYCYLLLGDSSAPTKRLRALESSNDGFRLAELDLELRGPGAIYGSMQHGQLDLRIASLTDVKLIAEARGAAQEFIGSGEKLVNYNHLNARVTKLRAVTNLN
jgi:ATP-dependent DNA helicase RecG